MARRKTPRRRARRSSFALPRLPPLEQRHYDVVGLGLVALAAFLAFVFYLDRTGGRVGEALADGLVFLFGVVAYAAPVALALLGGLVAGSAGGLRAARLRPADALRHLG